MDIERIQSILNRGYKNGHNYYGNMCKIWRYTRASLCGEIVQPTAKMIKPILTVLAEPLLDIAVIITEKDFYYLFDASKCNFYNQLLDKENIECNIIKGRIRSGLEDLDVWFILKHI